MTGPRPLVLGRPTAPYCSTVAEVAARLVDAAASSGWMTAGLVDALGLPAQLDGRSLQARQGTAHVWAAAVDGWQLSPGGLFPWMNLHRPDDKARVAVVVPSWDPESPWAAVADRDLGAELGRFRRAVGIDWWRSPALTSDRLIRDTHRRGRQPGPTETPEVRSRDSAPTVWARAPEGAERRARYCHAYDVNGQYLAATSSLPLPTGPAVAVSEYDPSRPGYWHLDDGWWTTPTVEYRRERAAAAGVELPTPSEGWTWAEHHRYLEGWYRRLRDGRARLLDAGEWDSAAGAAIKLVYSAGVSRLASRNRPTLADPLYQPYWRDAVEGLARANLHRAVAACSRRPVAVRRDTAWWLTSVADPEAFAGRLGLVVSTQLGKWKHAGTIAGVEARDMLASQGGPMRATSLLAAAIR